MPVFPQGLALTIALLCPRPALSPGILEVTVGYPLAGGRSVATWLHSDLTNDPCLLSRSLVYPIRRSVSRPTYREIRFTFRLHSPVAYFRSSLDYWDMATPSLASRRSLSATINTY